VSAQPIVATPRLRILASNGTLLASGTLLAEPTEYAITSARGPPTILLTLLQDAWADGLGVNYFVYNSLGNGTMMHANEAAARALIANLRSQQNEPAGWGQTIQPALTPFHLTRLNNQTLQITLPNDARSAYDITAPETIVMTVPDRYKTLHPQI
jgi:hypothetical protein